MSGQINQLSKISEKIENQFAKSGNGKTALAYAVHLWMSYRISGESVFLHKAKHIIAVSYSKGLRNNRLRLCKAWLHLELGEYDEADEILTVYNSGKNYYKINEQREYAVFLFLSAILAKRLNKSRAFVKLRKQLAEYSEGKWHYIYGLLMGTLYLEQGEYTLCADCFASCLEAGCRSPFLFVFADYYFTYVRVITPSDRTKRLFETFLIWALRKGYNLSNALLVHQHYVTGNLLGIKKIYEPLYAQYQYEWILKGICSAIISGGQHSREAFDYLKEAEKRQIYVKDLFGCIIKTAIALKIEDTSCYSHYTMEEFLKVNDAKSEELLFLYHILITVEKLNDLAERYKSEIIRTALHCLDERLSGTYSNSLYWFFLKNCGKDPKLTPYIAAAEFMLEKSLFVAEIVDDQSSFLWIIEPARRELIEHEFVNGRVNAVFGSGGFTYFCLDENRRKILNSQPVFRRQIMVDDIELYLHFYHQGNKSFELLTRLAEYYMGLQKPEDNAISVYKDLLGSSCLSKSLKAQVSAALGDALYRRNNSELALAYYIDADENHLNEKYIERMLLVFLDTKEFDKAIRLIVKKAHCISDRAMFTALTRLSQIAEYKPMLANAAYELIMKSWYDRALLNLVLEYYKGSNADWQELSNSLALMSVFELELDRIILKNSMWMRSLDAGVEQVFIRLYNNFSRNTEEYAEVNSTADQISVNTDEDVPQDVGRLIDNFVYFLTYKLLTTDYKPEYEIIGILENRYMHTKDVYLNFALGVMYAKHKINSLNSAEILRDALFNMADEKIIFPEIQNYDFGDKKVHIAYIEKNCSFLYRAAPDKTIKLYYRFGENAEFNTKPMRYIRFGMYYADIPHFSGEKISYYYSDEMENGSVDTLQDTVVNSSVRLYDKPEDLFYVVNNALVFERMFKYDKVEEAVTGLIQAAPDMTARIL